MAAFYAGFGADIDDMFGHFNRVSVMFHHDDRIPQFLERADRPQKLTFLRFVQPHRGFIEDIDQRIHTRVQVRSKKQPLDLAAGEGWHFPVQRQVTQAHLDQGAGFAQDFIQQVFPERGERFLPQQNFEEILHFSHRHPTQFSDILTVQKYTPAFFSDPGALAI